MNRYSGALPGASHYSVCIALRIYQHYVFHAVYHLELKHTPTLFYLSDHLILNWEWGIIVNQVQTDYHGRPWDWNLSGVTELLIMRDPQYVRMCFKSV